MTVRKRMLSSILGLLFSMLFVFGSAALVVAEEVITPPDKVVLDNGVRLSLTELYDTTCYRVYSSPDVAGDVVIPDSYMNIPVRQIQTGSFKENKNITSVTMPDTVWEIANGAFNKCPNLKWINISKNVTEIDNEAFLAMYGLEEFRMGENLTDEGYGFSYNTNWNKGPQTGYMNYFVRDGVLFSNDSLYFIGSTHRYFDNVKLEHYPQGKTDKIYKIPNDVVSTDISAFLSPVHLETIVVPASVRYFATKTVYFYDANDKDPKACPINVVFQHSSMPESVRHYYINESGKKLSNEILLYISGGWIYDSWDGSKLCFENENVKNGFLEKEIAIDAKDGDGGSELPEFVVAPKATEELMLETKVDRIKLGDTITVYATQAPLDTTDDLEFSTADESVASFDGFNRGYLTANGVGTTTYYVKSGDKVVEHQIEVYCEHKDAENNETFSEWIVEEKPTCEGIGSQYKVCTIEGCGQRVATENIPALGHKNSEWIVDVDPDCYNEGSKFIKCTVCSKELDRASIPALNHTINGASAYTYYSEVSATCTADGHEIVKCELCDHVKDGDVLTALGHDYADSWTVDVKQTCTTEGSKSHHCSRCDSKADVTVIVADGHFYGEWVIDTKPTCTENGSEHKTCSTCGDVVAQVIELLGHDYAKDFTEDLAPTCTEVGSKSRHCSRCSDKTDITEIPATGHNYTGKVTKEPTCTELGVTLYTCENCKDTYTEDIAKAPHSYSKEFTTDVAPTCTETGLKSCHCSECDATTDETVIEALGHDYGEYIIDEQPDCENNGSKHKDCSRCDTVIVEDIKALGHSFSEDSVVDVEPTCTEEGSRSRHCIICSAVTDILVIPATGHTEVTDYGYDATCTEDGLTDGVHCPVCSATLVKQTIIPAKGHTEEVLEGKDATCTDSGLTEGKYCADCGNVYEEQEKIPALGHDFCDWYVEIKATCTEDGTDKRVCSRCTETERRPREADGHFFGKVITDSLPTCTTKGQSHRTCAMCDEIEYIYLDAFGHTYSDEWIIDAQPTCTTDGSKSHLCENCGEKTDITVIKAEGHKESAWIVDDAATCSAVGSQHKECTVCKNTLATEEIPMLAHRLAGWVVGEEATCTEDGYEYKKCRSCKKIVETQTVPATGHPEDTVHWVTNTAATCTKAGSKYQFCDTCGTSFNHQTIAAKGHTEGDWVTVKKATCTATGSKRLDCAVCGVTLQTATISKVAHKSSSWITDKAATVNAAGSKHKECTVCGKVLEKTTIKQLKPGKPKLTKVSNATNGVKIQWDAKSGADTYRVYRKVSGKSWEYLGSTSKRYYVDKTAKSGTKYYYGIKARNEAGNSDLSATKSIYHLYDPTLKSATSTRSGITLKWTSVKGATGYYVYRETSTGSLKKIATVKGSSKVSYTDKSAKKGKKYTYKIVAYYGTTKSAASNAKTLKDKY